MDISLVRPNGTTFDGYDELDGDYVFTVRMKLEGNLANLDPETLSVYRIHEDGEMEPVTCWVHDGYLYIATDHFSPYAIVGQAKSATGSNTGTAGNGSQGNGTGTGDTQGGGTTTVADKGGASGTSTAKNDAAKTSGATRSGTPPRTDWRQLASSCGDLRSRHHPRRRGTRRCSSSHEPLVGQNPERLGFLRLFPTQLFEGRPHIESGPLSTWHLIH